MELRLTNNTDETVSVSKSGTFGVKWLKSLKVHQATPRAETCINLKFAKPILEMFRSVGHCVKVRIGEGLPHGERVEIDLSSPRLCQAVELDQYVIELCFSKTSETQTMGRRQVQMAVHYRQVFCGSYAPIRAPSSEYSIGERRLSSTSTASLDRNETISRISYSSIGSRQSFDRKGAEQINARAVSLKQRSFEGVEDWIPPKVHNGPSEQCIALRAVILNSKIGSGRRDRRSECSSIDSTSSIETSSKNSPDAEATITGDNFDSTRPLAALQLSPTGSVVSPPRLWHHSSSLPRRSDALSSLADILPPAWRRRSVCDRVPEDEASRLSDASPGAHYRTSYCPIKHRDALLKRQSLDIGSDLSPFGITLNAREQCEQSLLTSSTFPRDRVLSFSEESR